MKRNTLIGFFFMFVIGSAFCSTASTGLPWEDTIYTLMESVKYIVLPLGVIAVIAGAGYIATREGQGVGKIIWVFVAIAIAGFAPTLITKLSGVSEGATVNEIQLSQADLDGIKHA